MHVGDSVDGIAVDGFKVGIKVEGILVGLSVGVNGGVVG